MTNKRNVLRFVDKDIIFTIHPEECGDPEKVRYVLKAYPEPTIQMCEIEVCDIVDDGRLSESAVVEEFILGETSYPDTEMLERFRNVVFETEDYKKQLERLRKI